MSATIEKQLFGVTRDGEQVHRYRLANGSSQVDIISYGGCITSWVCADSAGNRDDIVLGYDTLAEYENCGIRMGSLVGRYANRIAHGRFELDGIGYDLEKNDSDHHLHGGSGGFHQVRWRAEQDQQSLLLSHHSVDGDGGYPGALDVQVRYTLTDQNELAIEYSASTDKATVVSLTGHCYFNLRGHQYAGSNGVLDHQLQLAATQVLEVDEACVPSGAIADVKGSKLDFTNPLPLGTFITDVATGDGFDHCYVLDGVQPAATLTDPVSGRRLEMQTTMPGMQLYSAEHVDGHAGKSSAVYGRRGSVCLEAQYFPDSPNHAHFPSTELRPGQTMRETTRYRLLPN